MPIYTYTCTACNDVLEKRQSFSDPPLTTCEQCGGALRKIIHPVGIVFKGSGWYITDSRSSTASANGSATGSKDGASGESKDSGTASKDAGSSTTSSSSTTATSSSSTSSDTKSD